MASPIKKINRDIARFHKLISGNKVYILKCPYHLGNRCIFCDGKGFEIRFFKPTWMSRRKWRQNLITIAPIKMLDEIEKCNSISDIENIIEKYKLVYQPFSNNL